MVKTYGQLFTLEVDPLASDRSSQTQNIRVCLFRDVKNADELRKLLHSKVIDCALIRAELIVELFQLLTAANRALGCMLNGKMATHTVHTEIVYALSPTRNISESLRTFGISDTTADIVVVIHDDVKGTKMNEIAKQIDGRPVTLEQLKNIADYELIKKIYHVQEPELNAMTIDDALVTRIVAKDFI